jgi:RNA polymerase sigma-70 factor (ECF subfamily)
MMFSCCHPRLPEEAQVALVLHILCGFSVDEIAGAFVSSHAAIEKRITRSKKVLAESKKLFEIADAEDFAARLSVVQRALYLLFNEGYHGASSESAVRGELCQEAMRLAALLLDHPLAATPATYALCALMCFNAARLPARVDESGNLSSLFEQDRSRWDRKLIIEGRRLLELSATGPELTEYHVEAAIASIHAEATGADDTYLGTDETVALHMATARVAGRVPALPVPCPERSRRDFRGHFFLRAINRNHHDIIYGNVLL